MAGLEGQVLGNYQILREITQSKLSTLYLARQRTDSWEVALRVIPCIVDEQRDYIRRFQQEAGQLASLQHRNVVPIYAYGEEQNLLYLAMPFIPKGSLKAKLGSPLSLVDTYRYLHQIATGLTFVHEHGLLHRDLRPANILIGEEGQLMLANFGLESLHQSSGIISGLQIGLGTPEYMAPEQALRHYDTRSDLYSLGIILYEMLTGRVPFSAPNPLEVILKQNVQEVPLLRESNPAIPEKVEAVVLQALAKNGDERFQTARELVTAFYNSVELEEDSELFLVQRPVEEGSTPRMEYIVEHTLPFPIARPFYELRAFDDEADGWKGEIPQLAQILVAALQYIAILALADYFAGFRQGNSPMQRPKSQTNRLEETFRKPLSHGQWVQIIRETLTVLNQDDAPFMPELSIFYFENGGRQMADKLVALRNQLIKRADTGVNERLYRDFKKMLFQFLQGLAFLKNYPLVSVRRTAVEGGVKTHTCNLHMGFHDKFSKLEMRCDRDLERDRLLVLRPEHNEFLYLYPFYQYKKRCTEECGQTHFFKFELFSRGKGIIEYIASGGGHKLADEIAATDLMALLAGDETQGGTQRQQTRYLSLNSQEQRLQLAPGIRVAESYEVLEHLRRGSMADVYKVRHLPTGEVRALKLLPFQYLADSLAVRRFQREAQRMSELDSPRVVKIFESGEDIGSHYLVMELATGWPLHRAAIAVPSLAEAGVETLSSVGNTGQGGQNSNTGRIQLAQGVSQERATDLGDLVKPVSEREALCILKQICEGLYDIHNHGMIHRDIKPGNLLLFEEGWVKVTDFGVVRSQQDFHLTMSGLTVGTPEYISPEQASGSPTLDPRADLYSLGVIAYELLTGKVPFKRSTALQTAIAHLQEPVPPFRQTVPALSPALESIVMKLLQKDPALRYSSAREVLQDILAYEAKSKYPDRVPLALQREQGAPPPLDELGLSSSSSALPQAAVTFERLVGHVGVVSYITWSPDGTHLASASFDRTIKIWNFAHRHLVQNLTGHQGFVRTIGWSPDGQRLVSASLDRTIRLWEVAKKKPVGILSGHSGFVFGAAWSPDGSLIASGSEDRSVKLWDVANWREVANLSGHEHFVFALSWSPAGKELASGSFDRTVRIWEVGSTSTRQVLSGHTDGVRAVSWSPDGALLASASADKTVRIWEVRTGRMLRVCSGHSSTVTGVAWSPNGLFLASSSSDATVKIWNAVTGQELKILPLPGSAATSLSWSPDGEHLAAGSEDHTIYIWRSTALVL